MSIFRTIKKLRDCDSCEGTGKIGADDCVICNGTGKVEILARVSQAAASRAMAATKELPQRARAAIKERLQDHELPKGRKESKVGTGVIDEDT
jgi:RecJ-like exonuclease